MRDADALHNNDQQFSPSLQYLVFPVAAVCWADTVDGGNWIRNRLLMRIFVTAIVLVISPWLIQPALAQARVALVIGNGAYEKVPELPNPTQDAADIGRALERLGFKVTQIKNATAQAMRNAMMEFGRTAEGSEMGVVFYAGHGMEVGGENWLIPIGAELRSDADIENEAVSLRSISLQVSKARKIGLVILDACRNNPFAAKMKRSISTRAVVRGLAPTEPSENVLIAYAARDGTTAGDGDGRNSPFTTALLHHIETPGLEISFLFRRVRDDVMTATKREQQPFVYGSLSKEEIYLKAAVAAVQASPAPAPVPPVRTEDEQFWQAIQTSNVAGLYEEFLSRYPRSNHVADARQRIRDLKAKEIAAIAPSASSTKPETLANLASEAKPLDRNLFTAEDGRKIAAIAATQQLNMPNFTITRGPDGPLDPNSKFVGVWSNKQGWAKGKGRYGMLIVTEVSATGLAKGYYLWGNSTKASWTKDPAGYKSFQEFIAGNAFSITGTEVSAKLNNNVLTLTSFKKDKPSETSRIDLRPVWQLVRARDQAEPSAKREKPSRSQSPRKESSAETSPDPVNAGTTMEERYRACRKLVKVFARREACARTGSL